MVNVFKKIGKFFKEIPKASKKLNQKIDKDFKKTGKAMGKGFKGITGKFTKIFEKIKEIELVIKCVANIFESIKSYINCFFDKIVSIPKCFIYYVLQIAYNICFSLPYSLIIYFIPQIKFVLDMIFDMFMYIDNLTYKNAKFHIFDFQESTKDKCFRCRNLKPFPDFKNLKKCGKKSKKNKNIKKCNK